LDNVNFPPSISTEYILVNPRSGESPIPFQSGEILRGTVIDPVDPLHTLIRIKGEEILVENRAVSLTQGRELTLQVEEIHPKVILKIIPEESLPGARVESFLMKYLSSDCPLEKLAENLTGLWGISVERMDPEVQGTLKQLFSLLNGFSPLLSPSGPAELQGIVAQSGLFWEAKLRRLIEGQGKESFDSLLEGDLKGLLLKLKAQLNSLIEQKRIPEPAGIEKWVQALDQFVDKIELYQILNLSQADSKENLLLLFPLWVQNHLQFVELNFSFPRQGAATSAAEESSIFFLLHFPDWGRMRIEVRVKEKSLSCSFTVSDPKVKEFLDRALPELSARLHQIGYGVLSHVSVEKAEKISPSLIPEMERWLNSLLNLVV
jgi:hypothetical protein